MDGDRVAQFFVLKATHHGEFMGLSGTGRCFEIQGVFLMQLREGIISEERLQGMEETRREGADPEHFAPFVAYLASDAAANINGCVFVASRATIGVWNHPAIVHKFTRDWEIEEPWSIAELEMRVPAELLADYANPAPAKA